MYQAQRRACLVSYATTCLVHCCSGILQTSSFVAPQLLRCKGIVRAPVLCLGDHHFSHHFVHHRRGICTGSMEMRSKARVYHSSVYRGKMRFRVRVTLLWLWLLYGAQRWLYVAFARVDLLERVDSRSVWIPSSILLYNTCRLLVLFNNDGVLRMKLVCCSACPVPYDICIRVLSVACWIISHGDM